MLQIITGKFFQTGDLYKSLHRAVLYTNYRPFHWEKVETIVGTISPTALTQEIITLVYEVEEKLEKKNRNGEDSILVSTGGQALINDFSTVFSFVLNVTCNVEYTLVNRLTGKVEPERKVKPSPNEFVKRVFDSQIISTDRDENLLQTFLEDLVGLERKTYRAVMRAIHRYVTALYRISDDIDLSYSLLVASIESLVQGFDFFEPIWGDFDLRKRKLIDNALTGANDEVQRNVRQAILEIEYVALSRRFREFTIQHLAPSFFREESIDLIQPIPKSELYTALNRAYQFRSQYVHTLQELPKIIKLGGHFYSDYIIIENKPTLSLNGLARIARHVIFQFVARAVKVSKEAVNYRAELPNIVQVNLVPQYWVWKFEGYDTKTANRFLAGFLSMVAELYTKDNDKTIPNMEAVLEKIERTLPTLSTIQHRLPILFLYWYWHFITPSDLHRNGWLEFANQFNSDFDFPSIESILFHVLTDQTPEWTLEESLGIRDKYYSQRHYKNGLRLGYLYEAIITLWLAKSFQQQGDLDQVKELVSQAVEDNPGHNPLSKLETLIHDDPLSEINPFIVMNMVVFQNNDENSPIQSKNE